MYLSYQRQGPAPVKGYLTAARDLVVEVLSPDDRWSEVMEKFHDYFAAGVDRVWVLDPRVRRVFAYRSPSHVETFGDGQTLTDAELLPGFGVAVRELFGGG